MELVKLEKPQLPVYWEYDNSVKFVSKTIFKWKKLTEDVAKELWTAREMIRKQGARNDLTSDQLIRSWESYCIEIGSSKGVVNRWLKRWFEQVHVSQNSGENEWYTPPNIIESAKNVIGNFDLDPATSELANEIIQAENIYTENDNGLEKEWYGNVWLNPPYSQPLISEFSKKVIKELPNIDNLYVLVNNATETNWCQDMMQKCNAICFIKGRLKFIDKNGQASGAPLQGQIVIYFGNNVDGFKNEFKKHGLCMGMI